MIQAGMAIHSLYNSRQRMLEVHDFTPLSRPQQMDFHVLCRKQTTIGLEQLRRQRCADLEFLSLDILAVPKLTTSRSYPALRSAAESEKCNTWSVRSQD